MTSQPAPLGVFCGYGVELEYMIVERDSLTVLPIADALLGKDAGGDPGAATQGRFAWSNELALHVIEISNAAPEARLDGLAAGFQAEVGRINALLANFNARLMPGAMHPWMNPATETQLWPYHNAAIYRAYDRIFGCRSHGWGNIQSMHLNLPFADDQEFARLHAAVRLLLPILPALAASSPIADGRARAALDFRMECYRFHAARVPALVGALIPDNAASRAAYQNEVLAPLYRDIAAVDPDGVLQHEWLNARGAIPRFERNALEIRIIDVQECPQADLAIAALASAVVRALYDGRWSTVEAQRRVDANTLGRLMLACIRDADRAIIDDARYLALFGLPPRNCEARELWRDLLAACSTDALLSQVSGHPLDVILSHGPLARRILGALGDGFDRPRLQIVYAELANCLADGRLFADVAA